MARHFRTFVEFDRHRSVCARALVAALVAGLALSACAKRDPLPAIREQQEQGKFEATIEPLRDLLRDRPEDPEVNFLYAHALVATQRPSLATWALRKAMESPEWTAKAGLELAYASLESADYNEAIEAATRVLDLEPDNVSALLARANAEAYWRKEPEKALADAARAAELEPDSLDAMKPRILALLVLERTDEARDAIAEMGRRIEDVDAPDATRSWFCVTKAIFTNESGDAAGAAKLWPECLAKYPAVPDVVFSALQFYDEAGQPQQSLDVLRKALAADPNSLTWRSALADRLRLAGDAAESERLLVEATQTEDPAAATAAWFELGRFRRNAQNPAGAAEAMKRAYELAQKAGPVSPQLPFEYAETLMLSQQFDEALAIADKLTVPAHRHMIRARVEQERGNARAALAEFDEAFRLWPDNPWARYYAARAAEVAGDFDRALEEYRTSIRIEAGVTDARTRAAKLLAAEGKPRMAAQMLRQPSSQPLESGGQLLSLYLTGSRGTPEQIAEVEAKLEEIDRTVRAEQLAELARGVSESSRGPKAGLDLLRKARGIDLTDPGAAAALREIVRLSHAAGERATPAELRAALAKHADAGAFQEIRGLDLELAGDADGARAAYQRAVDVDADDAHALAGLGRLTRERDPEAAIGFFDRAATADPDDPEPALLAARAAAASGKVDDAARRLDELLGRHPLEAQAAALRATLDLDRGIASAETLERARRAARLGGGADALDLVGRVHEKRGETEEATRVAERARALREKKGSSEKDSSG
jgi:tetratricopeptide (TPR) repeat protein